MHCRAYNQMLQNKTDAVHTNICSRLNNQKHIRLKKWQVNLYSISQKCHFRPTLPLQETKLPGDTIAVIRRIPMDAPSLAMFVMNLNTITTKLVRNMSSIPFFPSHALAIYCPDPCRSNTRTTGLSSGSILFEATASITSSKGLLSAEYMNRFVFGWPMPPIISCQVGVSIVVWHAVIARTMSPTCTPAASALLPSTTSSTLVVP
mmetsp:Transcript_10811/g.16266  ORF Transcript_10811/g.16266 Transcript_10811/m.16266 type:complete len:205 (-) Transcript_10811:488-1102(-)